MYTEIFASLGVG